jgi:hypothetical protein
MKLIDGYVGMYDGWWHNGGGAASGGPTKNYTHENATDTADRHHLFNLTADPNEREVGGYWWVGTGWWLGG